MGSNQKGDRHSPGIKSRKFIRKYSHEDTSTQRRVKQTDDDELSTMSKQTNSELIAPNGLIDRNNRKPRINQDAQQDVDETPMKEKPKKAVNPSICYSTT